MLFVFVLCKTTSRSPRLQSFRKFFCGLKTAIVLLSFLPPA